LGKVLELVRSSIVIQSVPFPDSSVVEFLNALERGRIQGTAMNLMGKLMR